MKVRIALPPLMFMTAEPFALCALSAVTPPDTVKEDCAPEGTVMEIMVLRASTRPELW